MIDKDEYITLVCCLNLSLRKAHTLLEQPHPDHIHAQYHLEQAIKEAKKLRKDLMQGGHL